MFQPKRLTMGDLEGRTLGHYHIVERIGAGGMGEVYRARDERLDRDVAIKVLPEAVAGDPERKRRFEREAKALAALIHPNIATIYGFESDGDAMMGTVPCSRNRAYGLIQSGILSATTRASKRCSRRTTDVESLKRSKG